MFTQVSACLAILVLSTSMGCAPELSLSDASCPCGAGYECCESDHCAPLGACHGLTAASGYKTVDSKDGERSTDNPPDGERNKSPAPLVTLAGYIQLEEPCLLVGYPEQRCLRVWIDEESPHGGSLSYIDRPRLDVNLGKGFMVQDPQNHPAHAFVLNYGEGQALELVTNWHVTMDATFTADGMRIKHIERIELSPPPLCEQAQGCHQPATPVKPQP